MHKGEFTFAGRLADHQIGAASHVAEQPDQVHQADDDDDHLEEVSQGNRPHAAEQGVQQHDKGAEEHALGGADAAVGDDVEHQTQRDQLGGNPAQVGHDDNQADNQLDLRAEALFEIVADGQQVHPV